MFQFLTEAAAKVRRQHRPVRRRVRRPLAVERLEERTLLSVVPVSSEFRVNTIVEGRQSAPDVAMWANGSSIVVWTSEGTGESDSIVARQYDAFGNPQGEEILVDIHGVRKGEYAISQPTVAAGVDGSFVVAWLGPVVVGDYGAEGATIWVRRFGPGGAPVGGGTPVNERPVPDDAAASPDIAMHTSGTFVVVWNNYYTTDIYGRIFEADGRPRGDEFTVNNVHTPVQYKPEVTVVPDGSFVVVWTSADAVSGWWITDPNVHARKFNVRGVPLGPQFRVNVSTPDNQQEQSVAMDGRGNFVVAWIHSPRVIAEPFFPLYARRYDAAGSAQSGDILLVGQDACFPGAVQVTASASGEFTIAWKGNSCSLDDGHVWIRSFTASGEPQGDMFRVDTEGAGKGYAQVAAARVGSEVIVAWTGRGSGDDVGVFARRLSMRPGQGEARTFVFSFLGFCGQVGEEPPSGMEKLWTDITADSDLAGTVVAAPPLGWPATPCAFRPFVVRRQMAAARLQVRQFLGTHQYDQRSDRVVFIGHSYGGNIAYELAVERAAGRRRQNPDPVEGLVTFDPIDWKLCRFQLINICVQSQHQRPAPRDVPLDNILNFVQRSPRLDALGLQALQGFTIAGARNEERGIGTDLRWGTLLNPSPDDTRHEWIDEDFGPGDDGQPGGGDDVSLGIFDTIVELLRRFSVI